MLKFVVVSVIALVVLQGVLARPKQEATAEKSQIDELAGKARQAVKNVTTIIDGNINSKQLAKDLTDATQTLATNINTEINNLAKQIPEHTKDAEDIINSVKETLKTTADKLQAAIGPEATKKANELKANLDEGINKAIAEAERLAKAAEPEIGKAKEDLNNFAKNLLNSVSELARNLKEKVDKDLAPKN